MKLIKSKLFKFLTIIIVVVVSFAAVNKINDDFEISKNLEIFINLFKELNKNYVDEINPGQLIKTAIDAMLESLDPFTNYIPEADIEDYKLMTTGKYGGIGSLIQQRDSFVIISEPYQNFPAYKAGIKAGDIILEINNESAKNKSVSDVSSILKGFPATEVEVLIKRPIEEKEHLFKIKREEIKIDNIPYYGTIADNIGYIKLSNFTFNAGKEVKEALVDLKTNNNITSLVLDLRGNGGGLLNEAINIVGLFVPQNTLVVKTKGKLQESNREYYTQSAPYDTEIPIVVLINYGSASASEIVAGAIQDLDRGIVIGQQSYGKGLVQNVIELNYNTRVKITVAKYYIPSGRCIQAIDYSNRDSLGRVINVKDMPKNIFYTKNKRPVYDAGGIIPDVKIEPKLAAKITISLIIKRLMFDFATYFAYNNNEIAKASEFKITDEIFNQFKEFLKDKDYDYTTESEKKLEELKEATKEEKYFENIQSEYDTLMKKLSHNKQEDLETFRDEISEFLANEIISRYYFQRGRVEHSLTFDIEAVKAKEILNNKEEYNKILTDTSEKL